MGFHLCTLQFHLNSRWDNRRKRRFDGDTSTQRNVHTHDLNVTQSCYYCPERPVRSTGLTYVPDVRQFNILGC